MSNPELVPYGRDGQRWVTREWESAVQRRGGSLAARPIVRESWQRSIGAAVPADLARAPMVMADDSLHLARERADWVLFAQRAAGQLPGAFASGHILSLFDAEGRMLTCQGDPRALEELGGLNFRPGALWTETAVGTNGPGTALATGRPVHIVGAEHFCETLHRWHCAAVPVRDQTTNEVLGVIDISGFRNHAHPHTLELAVALAASVEQMLTAREAERRYAVLHRLAELTTSYGAEALVAVDRGGRVLYATPSTPAGLRPDSHAPEALRAAIASHLRAIDGDARARDVLLELYEDVGLTAVSHPVLDGRTAVGACLLLRTGAAARTPRPPAATPATPSPAVLAVSRPRAGAAARYSFFDVIGQSPELAAACRVATAAAANALPVLIVGESGTGKEVFAQAIHEGGARRDRPFVAVNCAALPRELVESELFGYVGGAFSGARREGSPGKFQAAQGGTIFLDEIGELPPTAQATLLRVLQEGEITAVGSAHSKPVDVRVVAATNRDMQAALASGQLRSDLYYRLNVLSIELPPLRDRLDDVPELARHFLEAAEREVGRPGLAFAPAVIELFQRYAWPGNVREMKNLIRRLAALATGPTITPADLPPAIARGDAPAPGAVASPAGTPPLPGGDPERARTLAAVSAARTMAEAAARLGVTRSTLYRRLDRYGVHPERLLHTA